MTTESQTVPAGPPLAEEARYAVLAGLIERLVAVAGAYETKRDEATSDAMVEWWGGAAAATRDAISMARQCQHNANNSTARHESE